MPETPSGTDRRQGNQNSQAQNRNDLVQIAPSSRTNMAALKNIDVGETDANAEYFIALKSNNSPMYVKGFFQYGEYTYDQLKTSAKFILYGQKGTGKTAILRHLESQLSKNYETSFVVFKKEIVEEAQLNDIGLAGYLVDEESLKTTKLYYHAMKRLILAILLAKCRDIDPVEDSDSWFSSIIGNLKESNIGQIASYVTDSIISIVDSARISAPAASRGIVSVDASRLVKKSNDSFQKYAISQFKKKSLKARIFLDEMHFAYRDKDALSSDAALVRDTLLAAREINEKLIEEGIDSLVFVSVRSEFLEHQEIAVADIAHTIESYGVEISWEGAPYNNEHPMFAMISKRLQLSIGAKFEKNKIFNLYIPVQYADEFLEYTWGKPRDIVRYFKCAKNCYPESSKITKGAAYGAVIRRYSQAAWQDMKSAVASFVPKNSIPLLENALQDLASRNFDQSKRFKLSDMRTLFREAHDDMRLKGVEYDIDELIKLLYIIGIIFVSYKDASGQKIFHQFHRGNRTFNRDGEYFVHRAIAKALS